MTNLSSKKNKKKLITPENAVLMAPIIIGVIVFTSLFLLIFRPLISKLTDEESQIKILEEKISYISIYKKYINDLSIIQSKAQKQQQRLIDLISDPNELETILTEINKISIKNSLNIISIVPQRKIKYKDPNSSNNNKSTTEKDPFLLPSIEKHLFKVTLSGNYIGLINFLKELELLQTIVISDNINIDKFGGNESNLQMNLDISTYSKVNKRIQNNKQ